MNIITPGKLDTLVPIFSGTLLTDIIIILMNHFDIIFISLMLKRWYKEFSISAMLMDSIVIVLYILGGRYLLHKSPLPKTLFYLILCTVLVQVVGDLLFYKFYSALPRGSKVFDFFKDYTKEVSGHALWADAVMMVLAILFSNYFSKFSMYSNVIILLLLAYIGQYALHV